MSRWTPFLLIALVLTACSVDTFEPEGPQPEPQPEDPGEFAPSLVSGHDPGPAFDTRLRGHTSR